MAEDKKFRFENGQFFNRVSGEAIPDDEPVIIFRARDWHALAILYFYKSQITDAHHCKAVDERIKEFSEFMHAHPDRMKEPGVTHHYKLEGE